MNRRKYTQVLEAIESVEAQGKNLRDQVHEAVSKGFTGDTFATLPLGQMLHGEVSDWYMPHLRLGEVGLSFCADRIKEDRVDRSMSVSLLTTWNGGTGIQGNSWNVTISSEYLKYAYGFEAHAAFIPGDPISKMLHVEYREMTQEGMYKAGTLGKLVKEVTGDTEVIGILRTLQDTFER